MTIGSGWHILMFRSHGHRSRSTAGHWKNVVLSISLDPLAGNVTSLVQWMPEESRWPSLIFRLHGQRSRSNCWPLKRWSTLNISRLLRWKIAKLGTVNELIKGQGQTAGLCTNVVNLISFDSFAWKLSNLVQLMPLEKKISGHVIRGQDQNESIYSINQSINTKFAILIDYPYWYLVIKSCLNYFPSSQYCQLNILWTICLIITQIYTLVTSRMWIIQCINATILNFDPGGH